MITRTVVLACGLDRAFELFTGHASEWWPESRRHTADPRSTIQLLAGGRFFERSSSGEEVELGRVITWEPPHRLVLDFYVGTDAQHPTEVVVSFAAEGDGTRVTVEHRPKPESLEPWTRRAPAFERSWALLLESLAASAGAGG